MSSRHGFNKYAWERAILGSDLTKTERVVAWVLCVHADGKTGADSRPGLKLLMKESACGRATVVAALDTLRERGWIVRTYATKAGRGVVKADVYRLSFPYETSSRSEPVSDVNEFTSELNEFTFGHETSSASELQQIHEQTHKQHSEDKSSGCAQAPTLDEDPKIWRQYVTAARQRILDGEDATDVLGDLFADGLDPWEESTVLGMDEKGSDPVAIVNHIAAERRKRGTRIDNPWFNSALARPRPKPHRSGRRRTASDKANEWLELGRRLAAERDQKAVRPPAYRAAADVIDHVGPFVENNPERNARGAAAVRAALANRNARPSTTDQRVAAALALGESLAAEDDRRRIPVKDETG